MSEEENKKKNGRADHLKKHQFTPDRQPSPEAKSAGAKKRYEKRRLLKDLMDVKVRRFDSAVADIYNEMPELFGDSAEISIGELLDIKILQIALHSKKPMSAIKEIYNRVYGRPKMEIALKAGFDVPADTLEDMKALLYEMQQARMKLEMNIDIEDAEIAEAIEEESGEEWDREKELYRDTPDEEE